MLRAVASALCAVSDARVQAVVMLPHKGMATAFMRWLLEETK